MPTYRNQSVIGGIIAILILIIAAKLIIGFIAGILKMVLTVTMLLLLLGLVAWVIKERRKPADE